LIFLADWVCHRDETQLTKLQQLGMTPAEEVKLVAMREYMLKLATNISRFVWISKSLPILMSNARREPSFSSRLSLEAETERNLKTTGDLELQKLGVVPQTVFLKARTSDFTPRSSRLFSPPSRWSTIDMNARAPVLSPVRGQRMSSGDQGSTGAPFEDLRRRLAAINGSTSSLSQTHSHQDPRTAAVTLANTSVGSAGPDRPSSPTESIVSTSNSLTFHATQRLQVGSTDGQKAAPAIGSSKTNATGLLEATSKMRPDSPEPSGRSSPVSVARGQRQRVPSALPISTYGWFLVHPIQA
jgi:phosphoinositide-3-kinase regulatory subunit 4